MLIFVDESGYHFHPCICRTWAPRGETPVIKQQMRSYSKVSAIAAVGTRVNSRRARLFFRLFPGRNIRAREACQFLLALLRAVKGNIIVVWDNIPFHRSTKVRRLQKLHSRLQIEYLPPYAPELNPVEFLWRWTKYARLANSATVSSADLHRKAFGANRAAQRRKNLIRGFLRASSLFS